MQDKSKSPEMAVIHWLADYLPSSSFDLASLIKAQLQSRSEMSKSQPLLPRQQSQAPEAGGPKHDIARFPHMTDEERQARALRVLCQEPTEPSAAPLAPPDGAVQVQAESRSPSETLERGSTESPNAPPSPPDGSVQVREEAQSHNTIGQSASGAVTSDTPNGSSSSAPKQDFGNWGRPFKGTILQPRR